MDLMAFSDRSLETCRWGFGNWTCCITLEKEFLVLMANSWWFRIF